MQSMFHYLEDFSSSNETLVVRCTRKRMNIFVIILNLMLTEIFQQKPFHDHFCDTTYTFLRFVCLFKFNETPKWSEPREFKESSVFCLLKNHLGTAQLWKAFFTDGTGTKGMYVYIYIYTYIYRYSIFIETTSSNQFNGQCWSIFKWPKLRPRWNSLLRGWTTTQFIWRDYKYLVINQSRFHGSCQGFVAVAHMDVSLNGGTPISHPKCWSIFSRKTHGFVGETHHFRKHPSSSKNSLTKINKKTPSHQQGGKMPPTSCSISMNMAIFVRRTKRGLLAEYESTMPKFNLTGGATDRFRPMPKIHRFSC